MCCNFEAPWSFPFFLRIKEKISFILAANGPTLPGPSSRAALASNLAASCSRFSAAHMAHQILNTFCVSIYIIFVFLVFGRPRVAGPGTHLKWWWWWISEKPPENNWISRFGFCSFIHFLVLHGRIPSFFFLCVFLAVWTWLVLRFFLGIKWVFRAATPLRNRQAQFSISRWQMHFKRARQLELKRSLPSEWLTVRHRQKDRMYNVARPEGVCRRSIGWIAWGDCELWLLRA